MHIEFHKRHVMHAETHVSWLCYAITTAGDPAVGRATQHGITGTYAIRASSATVQSFRGLQRLFWRRTWCTRRTECVRISKGDGTSEVARMACMSNCRRCYRNLAIGHQLTSHSWPISSTIRYTTSRFLINSRPSTRIAYANAAYPSAFGSLTEVQ